MGKDIKDIKTNDSCSHAEGKDLPVCWDCAEEGHVKQKPAGEGSLSPTWENFRKLKKGLLSNKSASIGTQSSAPEVHPPEEGIEVGTPGVRKSQPGLEVVFGPRIVSPEDKFRRVFAGRNEDASSEQKEAEPERSRDGGAKIYGLRKRTFWVVMACALLVLIAVILGVAIGVTERNRAMQSTALSVSSSGDQVSSLSSSSSSSSPSVPSITTETMYMASTPLVSQPEGSPSSGGGGEPAADTAPSQPQETSTPTSPTYSSTQAATPSSPSPSSTSTSTSASDPTTPRPCFRPDGSMYLDPGTGSQFRVSCGVSLAGADIENLEASTMEACAGLCAADGACRGAVWYSAGPQGTDLNYCWLKSEMRAEEDGGRRTRDAQSVVRL